MRSGGEHKLDPVLRHATAAAGMTQGVSGIKEDLLPCTHTHQTNVIASRVWCVYVNFHAYICGDISQCELLQRITVLTRLSIVCLFTIFV